MKLANTAALIAAFIGSSQAFAQVSIVPAKPEPTAQAPAAPLVAPEASEKTTQAPRGPAPAKRAARAKETAPPPAGAALSLADYLGQVEAKHDGLRAAKRSSEAANLYVKDARISLMPALFGNAQYKEDRAPQQPLGIQYDVAKSANYQLGVSQQTSFGLGAKVYYNYAESETNGLKGFAGFPLTFSNVPRYYEGHPTIELTMPLWRNWLGDETRAQADAAEAQAKADRAGADFDADQTRFRAEAAYWRLVLAREASKISAEALDRTEQIDAWTRRRANMQLADRSDYLQSQASVKQHRVDLRARRDEERAAILAFNSLRGEASLDAPETLQAFVSESIQAVKRPQRTRDRGDVAVARERSAAAQAQARLARQRDLPTVEVYGLYALNGLQGGSNEAFAQSWQTDRPTEAIGLRFNAPLEIGALSDARRGREIQQAAADLTFKRAQFDQERDWDDLAQKFAEAQERLGLYVDLETAQRDKLNYERERQKRGRTTMDQVLRFEIDYENAQLARIMTLNELNQLNAQMKLFGVTYESR